MPAPPPSDSPFLALQEALAGRFSLERELGRGGMGIVYLAQDVRLDRPVALKLLPPEYAAQPALRERFIREARTAARLSHPHIVPIHLVDEVGDFVFFVMAFIEGDTLGRRVRERGPVAPREAARILREVAWALAYAHAQGVVHRDVKPDNILLESGSGRALVTDFGIARVDEAAGLTTTHEILGTPEYMSPEQASGEPVDGRSDIFALGVVGHFMLAGTLPFKGSSAQATLAKVLTQPAPPLAFVAPEVPGELAEAVDRCLAKDPVERFRGGEELADALGRMLLERREIPSAIRLFQEENRESTSLIVGLLMVVLVLVAATIVGAGSGIMDAGEILLGIGGIALWSLAPVGGLIQISRRLLKSGYGHDELVSALRSEVGERKTGLAPRLGHSDGRLDTVARTSATLGFGILTAGVGLILLPDVPLAWIRGTLLTGAVLGWGGLLVAIARKSFRRPVSGERWLGFWEGPLGRAVFRIAGLGLRPAAKTSGATYRPTEMAIGMAAERLFAELPRELRRRLQDLPSVVDALEAHAAMMRTRVHELERMQRELGGAGTPMDAGAARMPGLTERRDSVVDDLRRAREAAEERLREVVAALEGLRLQLLRLHAGAGSVENLTADLGTARALSEDVARLLEGQSEAERVVGRSGPPASISP